MNRSGFKYLQARKKGLLTKKDYKTRLEFARFAERELGPEFWTHGVTMYFDGVSFAHKFNPMDAALNSRSMVWRKPSEGLTITTKGCKVGAGTSRIFRLIVAISYGAGVVLCIEHPANMKGVEFAQIIRDNFEIALERCINPDDPLLLQVISISSPPSLCLFGTQL